MLCRVYSICHICITNYFAHIIHTLTSFSNDSSNYHQRLGRVSLSGVTRFARRYESRMGATMAALCIGCVGVDYKPSLRATSSMCLYVEVNLV